MKQILLLLLFFPLVTGYLIAQDSDTSGSSVESGSGLEGAVEREVGARSQPQIKRQDDVFTGQSGTELLIPLSEYSDKVHLRFQYVTREGSSSNTYFAVADLVLSDWSFIDEIYFLVDGERYRLESLSNQSTTEVVDSNTVREWVVFRVNSSMVHEMASADEIRVSLRGDRGRRDYAFRETDLEKLTEFAEITDDNS